MTANDGPVPDGWKDLNYYGAIGTVDGRCVVWESADVGNWYAEVNTRTGTRIESPRYPTREAAVAWCERNR